MIVLSWNIHNTYHNFLKYRKDSVGQLLTLLNPDIACFQEYGKNIDIKTDFRKTYLSNYDFCNVRESLGIAIKKNAFTFVRTVEPNNVHVNISIVKEVKNDKDFMIVNTHLDYKKLFKDDTYRHQQVKDIQKLIEENDNDYPIIFTGDFNSLPESDPINEAEKYYRDSFMFQYSDYVGTWCNYGKDEPYKKRIDYIFFNKYCTSTMYEIISEKVNDEFPSDHFPIITEISFVNSNSV